LTLGQISDNGELRAFCTLR